jgi:hypothetical protein
MKLPSEELERQAGREEFDQSKAKIAFSFIPYLGPALSEILIDFPNRIKQNRVNELVYILKDKIENMQENVISIEYLRSDDFHDLSILTFENATKIRNHKKRIALANLYIDSIKNEIDFEIDKNKIFIEFIADISEIQLILFKYIADFQDQLFEIESFEKFYNSFRLNAKGIEIGKYEFKYAINGLEAKALISLGNGLDDFYSNTQLIVGNDHKPASVKITDFGEDFIRYLKE